MNVAALIRILGAKGMSPDDIADVVEMAMPAESTRAERKRERDRDRIATKRGAERLSQESRDMSDIARQSDIPSQGSEEKVSPTPLSKTQPPNLTLEPPISPTKPARKARLGPAKGAFARFWAEYPLKVGKLAAEKAYAKAWGVVLDEDPDADPEAQILDGLKRCKPLFDPEYIQHPTTWLNKGGWMDQPEAEAIDGGAGPPKFDLAAFEARRAERDREQAA